MTHPRTRLAAIVAVLTSGWLADPASTRAEEPSPALARAVLETNQHSVVTVTGVARVTITLPGRPGFNPPEQETKTRANGTIVDANGLVVLSLNSIDPSLQMDGSEVNTPNGPLRMNAVAVVEELEIVLGDGTEIPAEMVFKDADLGLAFVRPKAGSAEAKGITYDPVDLTDAGTAQVADRTAWVVRLESFANQPAIVTDDIVAVIERPRPFHLVSFPFAQGCPAFTLDGKLLGIGVAVGKNQPWPAVIVPVAEVRKLIKQTPPAGDAAQPAAAAAQGS
jgi:hypothetical protein